MYDLYSNLLTQQHICSCSQGSAKLEKAEILQMTVDHLKMLHAAGGKGKVFITSTYFK